MERLPTSPHCSAVPKVLSVKTKASSWDFLGSSLTSLSLAILHFPSLESDCLRKAGLIKPRAHCTSTSLLAFAHEIGCTEHPFNYSPLFEPF